MAINGVNTNPLLNNLGALNRAGQTGSTLPGQLRPGVARPATTPPQANPASLKPQQSLASPSQTLPAEAPAGTDPALWSVLTTAERSYFAKAAATGPLTYGRVAAGVNAAAQAAPAARGGRLDVRA